MKAAWFQGLLVLGLVLFVCHLPAGSRSSDPALEVRLLHRGTTCDGSTVSPQATWIADRDHFREVYRRRCRWGSGGGFFPRSAGLGRDGPQTDRRLFSGAKVNEGSRAGRLGASRVGVGRSGARRHGDAGPHQPLHIDCASQEQFLLPGSDSRPERPGQADVGDWGRAVGPAQLIDMYENRGSTLE